MKDKALIIKTGKILDIIQEYESRNISIDLDNIFSNLSEDKKEELSEMVEKLTNPSFSKKEGSYYILSDNMEYYEDEVIVGLDNIRDYKISNQIKIDE